METPDVLKQLEINFGLVLNDLEFASHELDARMKDAARFVTSVCRGVSRRAFGTCATMIDTTKQNIAVAELLLQ